ncbi:MAG TPA: DinB family protein [Vicinamibacterales bacterium]|jgi:uncharacterized damage-inducible protein DinB|nr:DinB family protein [Vicinamibacterales bacterium]
MSPLDPLLVQLDTAYNNVSWHGPNLRGSLRGVSLDAAAWRPQPGAHNVWELLVHAAYWKYAAWRRLTGAARGSFPLEGSNFFERPVERTASAWRADLRLLEARHRELRAAVAATAPRALDARLPGSRVTRLRLITGVAAHDVYHAGQIQLLKKLYSRRRAGR